MNDDQILADMDRDFELACTQAIVKLNMDGIRLSQLDRYAMDKSVKMFFMAGASQKEALALSAILGLGMMAIARKGFETTMEKTSE